MKTKQQKKDTALEEYHKIRDPASKEYYKKCAEINNEFEELEEIIEHNGKRYKLINGN